MIRYGNPGLEGGEGRVRTIRCLVGCVIALGAVRAGAQGGVAGVVYDSLSSRAPLANAIVVLVELSRYATTDSHGRFRIDSVPDGRYTLGFTHAVLDSIDLEAPLVPVEIAGGHRASVTLATPSVATVYGHLCAGPRDDDTGVIIGRVVDVDTRKGLGGAGVSTEWTEYTIAGGRSATQRLRAAARTNASGVYLLCGVPTRVPLDVITELTGFRAGPKAPALDGRLIRRVDLALSLQDGAARVASVGDSSQAVPAAHGTATLRGTVVSSDGRPLHDAVVGILGTLDSARTNAAGAFVIEHLPAGTRTVEVRSIGWLREIASMDFPTNGVRDTTLSITRKAQALSPVAVEGTRSNAWMELSGFDARRKQGLGAFVTADEIAQHNYPDVTSILRGTKGIRVECLANKRLQGVPCYPIPLMMGISDFSRADCVPNFFVDGAQVIVDGAGPPSKSPFSDFSNMVPPASIRGMEIYSNPGTIPAQFDRTSTTGCGSIVIWTH